MATGIAELISQAMVLEGSSIEEARQHSWLFDIKGLVVTSRTDLQDFQRPFLHDHSAIATFVEAVETIRPTCIIGVSTVPKLFNQQVIV
jgi:malate dehydrogenase (oxaloacetate-decarboxylating)(NADP+)